MHFRSSALGPRRSQPTGNTRTCTLRNLYQLLDYWLKPNKGVQKFRFEGPKRPLTPFSLCPLYHGCIRSPHSHPALALEDMSTSIISLGEYRACGEKGKEETSSLPDDRLRFYVPIAGFGICWHSHKRTNSSPESMLTILS